MTVPENEREREGLGAKGPGNELVREREGQRANWPGSYWPIRSGERIGPGAKRLGTIWPDPAGQQERKARPGPTSLANEKEWAQYTTNILNKH